MSNANSQPKTFVVEIDNAQREHIFVALALYAGHTFASNREKSDELAELSELFAELPDVQQQDPTIQIHGLCY